MLTGRKRRANGSGMNATPSQTAGGLKAVIVPVTPFQQNCSLIWCAATKKGALVDAGGEPERLLETVASYGVTLESLLVTHGHLDHCGAVAGLARQLNLPVYGPHPDDRFWIEQLKAQAATFGFPESDAFTPTRWLADGDSVSVGEETLEVRHCPGHTPGHVIFHHAGAQLAFVGDVLFNGSIGRTDFPRGDHATLIRSIRSRLWPLGEAVRFVPGHGPMSTFGDERRSNPFVADRIVGGPL